MAGTERSAGAADQPARPLAVPQAAELISTVSSSFYTFVCCLFIKPLKIGRIQLIF